MDVRIYVHRLLQHTVSCKPVGFICEIKGCSSTKKLLLHVQQCTDKKKKGKSVSLCLVCTLASTPARRGSVGGEYCTNIEKNGTDNYRESIREFESNYGNDTDAVNINNHSDNNIDMSTDNCCDDNNYTNFNGHNFNNEIKVSKNIISNNNNDNDGMKINGNNSNVFKYFSNARDDSIHTDDSEINIQKYNTVIGQSSGQKDTNLDINADDKNSVSYDSDNEMNDNGSQDNEKNNERNKDDNLINKSMFYLNYDGNINANINEIYESKHEINNSNNKNNLKIITKEIMDTIENNQKDTDPSFYNNLKSNVQMSSHCFQSSKTLCQTSDISGNLDNRIPIPDNPGYPDSCSEANTLNSSNSQGEIRNSKLEFIVPTMKPRRFRDDYKDSIHSHINVENHENLCQSDEDIHNDSFNSNDNSHNEGINDSHNDDSDDNIDNNSDYNNYNDNRIIDFDTNKNDKSDNIIENSRNIIKENWQCVSTRKMTI